MENSVADMFPESYEAFDASREEVSCEFFLHIIVGLVGQKEGETVSIFKPFPDKKSIRKFASQFRERVVKDMSSLYHNFGLPKELTGFHNKDFFWVALRDKRDIETVEACSDNFFDSNFFKNPPVWAMAENPFEDFWYQQGYSDAKFQQDNRPTNSKNFEPYKRGIDDFHKSVKNLQKGDS